MSFRTFAIGLTASFAVAWLAVVILPFFKLQNPAPVSFVEGIDEQSGIYHPKRSGRVVNGYEVYAANGCYQCHTQVARPTYAGNDLNRPDLAGIKGDFERGDTRRESNVFDYIGLDFAPIGVTRLGPDLVNLGRRLPHEVLKAARDQGDDTLTPQQAEAIAERRLFLHLYNPRLDPAVAEWSACPPHRFLFEEQEIQGQRSGDALEIETGEGMEIVPKPQARALVSYLMSLKHDDPVPASMNYAPADAGGDDKEG